MAVRTGKDRATVANFLRLLRLPTSVQARVESGELSFGHARTLLAFEHAEEIEKAAQRIAALSLSVRQTENYVQGLLHPEKAKKKEPKPEPPVDPNVREAQDQLQRVLGLKVTIEDHNGHGKVIIEYARLEDFDKLLEQLARD
jgi:ParB family chromosome partitioning protein